MTRTQNAPRKPLSSLLPLILSATTLVLAACGGSNNGSGGGTCTANCPVTTYILTVNSTNPASGTAITVAPADATGLGNGTTSFTRTYATGASVTLTAPATSGTGTFANWTGCTSAAAAVCTVSVTANTTVSANYTVTPTNFTVTVNATNAASGLTIAATPADVNGLTSITPGANLTYASGASLTLTAPATSGTATFANWTGCTSAAAAVCTLSVAANATVTANYTPAPPPPPTTYKLTVNSSNPVNGVAITVSPADNTGATNGSTSFTRSYNSGTAVTLVAPASAGANAFANWTGCTSASTNTCKVTLTADSAVTANYTPAVTYTLTVNSTNPASGTMIAVTPADINNATSAATSFTHTYVSGTSVLLTAPGTAGVNTFGNWNGCTTIATVTCTVSMTANTTVTANYNLPPGATSITVSPATAPVTIGTQQQFTASVKGNGTFDQSVTWTLSGPTGYTGGLGTVDYTGLYTSPYPAPPSVTLTATSKATPSVSGAAVATLASPAAGNGPALSVDLSNPGAAISPLIYGMNGYVLDSATIKTGGTTLVRWGGDGTTRYNYKANTSNAASDYDFENFSGAGGMWPSGNFTDMITLAATDGITIIGNAPVIGWVASSDTSGTACSFQKSAYPNQTSYNGVCGSGTNSDGSVLRGSNTIAQLTSIQAPPPAPPAAGTAVASSWVGDWVTSIVATSGPGNPTSGKSTGVQIWDLDNEPEYWSSVHRDVHPSDVTYDEMTNGGIGTALAIKTADPTALVSGPVVSNWFTYFESYADVNSGYGHGPCYKPWDNPLDRQAHGGIPFLAYYLQQMAAAETTYGKRLLDIVDIHAYFAATYNNKGVGLSPVGDTGEQIARLNSTRVLWDPTYTDPNYPQPNYPTDANYVSGCNPPAQPPMLVPFLKSLVAKNYPGTKTSIDEYNFGGTEAINGAVAQADVLGIFGKYGLDMGVLWPSNNYNTQGPGTEAFAIYRNYDGNKSTFGDVSLPSSSANQGTLSVYGAQRTADGAVTVVVINKTYGDLTSTLSLPKLTATGPAKVFLYSNANLAAIVAGTAIPVTAPAAPSTTSTLTGTFPAQSITLLVIPTR